jgi:hypothetical protein
LCPPGKEELAKTETKVRWICNLRNPVTGLAFGTLLGNRVTKVTVAHRVPAVIAGQLPVPGHAPHERLDGVGVLAESVGDLRGGHGFASLLEHTNDLGPLLGKSVLLGAADDRPARRVRVPLEGQLRALLDGDPTWAGRRSW